MKLQIEVSQEDIDNGKKGNRKKCALALAMKRKFPKAFDVDVHPYYDIQSGGWWSCTIHSHEFNLSFDLKKEFEKFAADFDCGNPVEPCLLEVDLGK